MTNIGLQISLPLMINASTIVWAALNCRIDGDFFHVLGLPLEKVGVKQYVRRINMNPIHLSMESLSSYVIEDIFIQPNKGNRSFTWHQRHLGFIFRNFPSQRIEIREVYPQKFWQAQEKILQGAHKTWIRSGDAESRSWHVCLHLEVVADHDRTHMILVLGIKFRPCVEEKSLTQPWDFHDSRAEPWCILQDFPLAQAHLKTFEMHYTYNQYLIPPEKPYRFAEKRGVCVSFNDARPVPQKLGSFPKPKSQAFVDIMGQWMCVVNLALSDNEEPSTKEPK